MWTRISEKLLEIAISYVGHQSFTLLIHGSQQSKGQ